VRVLSIGYPEYPARARIDGVQGTVEVQVGIGVDGKVTFAKGWGAKPILVSAAEDNARRWMFGPFPPKSNFPMYRYITYVFRLEGHPVSVVTEPPDIKTDLPDSIEISAPPVHPDDEWQIVPQPKS